jgi:hypothetical protein
MELVVFTPLGYSDVNAIALLKPLSVVGMSGMV